MIIKIEVDDEKLMGALNDAGKSEGFEIEDANLIEGRDISQFLLIAEFDNIIDNIEIER